MYRQAMLARTALRASRTRGYATAAETSPADFASTRQAVREHAVGELQQTCRDSGLKLMYCRDYRLVEEDLVSIRRQENGRKELA
jgi:hypothetical protein